MYSKIAFGNVKKSFKDYTIYFLTLTLAVCIFYSFNSIESQKALIELGTSQAGYAEMLTQVISYVSVFVSIILGSLIIYANNFLIKKRNKELGIYMTLGMGKTKISRILVLETLLVGAISLVSGLILGLVVSQGLSVLVSKLFDVAMNEYTFVISTVAMGKTVIYFGIIFVLVMLFNTYIISKYKIIDLLTAGRKTQDIKFKNPIVYFITFILCATSIGISYKFILDVGLDYADPRFIMSIIFGIIGTVLFFFSLAGFILYIVKKNKKVYFKGLNIFVIKQLNSKVNTNFISMSVICLMLFITISVLSTGLGFKTAMESALESSTPYDVSMFQYADRDGEVRSIKDTLDAMEFKAYNDSKYVEFKEYETGLLIDEILPSLDLSYISDSPVKFIKLEDYNNLRALNNKEQITLSSDEILVLSNTEKIVPTLNKMLEENRSIQLSGKDYNIQNEKAIEENLNTDYSKNNALTIVINNEYLHDAKVVSTYLNINYLGENNSSDDKEYIDMFKSFKDGEFDYDKYGFILGNTRLQTYDESKGMTTTILFIGMYLGVIFLISSMAVLALQQLSEASDSIDRYASLKKLGANKKDINKTIFIQTLVYFSLPVLLALVHSFIGIKVANGFLELYGKPDIGASAIVTAGIFLVIYTGYFFATYTGYRNIVKSKI